MTIRLPHAVFVSFFVAGFLNTGCQRDAGSVAGGESGTKPEVEGLRQKLATAEQTLAARNAELSAANAAADEAAKASAAKWQAAVEQKEAEIAGLKAASEGALKDGWPTFAEASAYGKKGPTTVALGRYQAFLEKYPESPLAIDAQRAVVELAATEAEASARRANLIDPKRAERELLKRFAEGIATGEELAPLLKGKSRAAVVKLLGSPNRTYRNNSEIGYEDGILDRATGRKATLVVSFTADRVTKLRLGYAGREIMP